MKKLWSSVQNSGHRSHCETTTEGQFRGFATRDSLYQNSDSDTNVHTTRSAPNLSEYSIRLHKIYRSTQHCRRQYAWVCHYTYIFFLNLHCSGVIHFGLIKISSDPSIAENNWLIIRSKKFIYNYLNNQINCFNHLSIKKPLQAQASQMLGF